MRRQFGSWDALEARSLGEVARKLLREKKFYQKGKFGPLSKAWEELIGESLASCTKIVSFDDGELVVEVDSPSLLHEINNFMTEMLLDGLQETKAGRDIESLRFRLASYPDRKRSEDA